MSATPSLSVVARRMWNKNSRHVGFAFDGTAMAMADCECKHTSGWKSRSRTDLLLPLSSEIGWGKSDGELRNVDEIERGTSRGSAHGNGAAKATNECSTQNSGGAQHQRRMLRRRRLKRAQCLSHNSLLSKAQHDYHRHWHSPRCRQIGWMYVHC